MYKKVKFLIGVLRCEQVYMRTLALGRVAKMPAKKTKTKKDADGFTDSLKWDIPEADEILHAKVTGVKLTTRGEQFEKFEFGEASDKLLVVRIELENGTSFEYSMTQPKPDSPLNPRSNIYGWYKAFKGMPHAGQDVMVKMNDKGFFNPVF